MNGYYPRQQQYGGDDTQANGQNIMGMMGPDCMAPSGAQSFDEKSMRRRSMPMSFGGTQGVDVSMRRMTMMEFSGGPLDNFQFDPSAASTGFDATMTADIPNQMNGMSRARRASQVDLSINTQLPNQGVYGAMPQTGSAFASPMNINRSLDVDLNSPYITSAVPLNMDFSVMANEISGVDMFGAPNFDSPMVGSPVNTNFAGSMMGPTQDPGGGIVERSKSSLPSSTENGTTPDFRTPASRTGSHEGSVQPSTRGTSASAGPQSSQMPSIAPQMAPRIAPPMSAASFIPQTPSPSAGAPETIGGTVLPWSTPAGQPWHFPAQYAYELLDALTTIWSVSQTMDEI